VPNKDLNHTATDLRKANGADSLQESDMSSRQLQSSDSNNIRRAYWNKIRRLNSETKV